MRAILFDMDGTLLDSMHAWYEAEVGYLKDQGIDEDELDYERLLTSGSDEVVSYLRDDLGMEVDAEEMRQEALQNMERFYASAATAKDGVERALQELAEMGIPMAVGSSTPEHLCEIGMETTELRSYFDFILSATESGLPKFQPAFFEEAASRFGVDPEEMVVFDDALLALRAARECGCPTVGVADEGYLQDEDAVQYESDEFIYSFADFSAEDFAERMGWNHADQREEEDE